MSEAAVEWDGKLSYSSFNLFMSCNRKYYLNKIAKVSPDPDATVDTLAFRFGKAFHKLLEDVGHNVSEITKSKIDQTCEDFDLVGLEHGPHLFALLRHYKRLQAKNELVATHFELEVVTAEFRGFIDVILKDKDGPGWWIGDMKTAAAYSPFLNSKLPTDWQLNLYARHVPEIAGLTGHKVEDFKGCRYLLNAKSRLKLKKDDTFKSYAERLEAGITSFDIPVYKEELQPDSVYAIFRLAHKEISSLYKYKSQNAVKLALPNYNCCTSYYKPCEFWSQCHGKSYSELQEREVLSSD